MSSNLPYNVSTSIATLRKLFTGKNAPKRLLSALPFSNYTRMSAVAIPPVHAWERPIYYGMQGNDMVGCCAYAAVAHILMNDQAVANAGTPLPITTDQTIDEYAKGTGYNPQTGAGDNGSVLTNVLSDWKSKGLFGTPILGFATLDVTNIDQIKAAIYTFGSVYIGFSVPQSMADQLNSGVDPDWAFRPNDKPSGEGHCVPFFGYGRSGGALCSWAKIYRTAWDFWMQNVDEAYAVVSPKWIKQSGQAPSGIDITGLVADLATV